jgi:hypothetical protein
MSEAKQIEQLSRRLTALEDEKLIRACMNRYMLLCDQLDAGFDLELLIELFTEQAVWQGIGRRYANTFGQYQGREAIAAMFDKYTKPPAHFDLNVHVLGNESITVEGDSGKGSWVLVQTSTFATGKSQLSCARISAEFQRQAGDWKISLFQTESLFNRPVEQPWDATAALPVPE